jgi:hypothetical protein
MHIRLACAAVLASALLATLAPGVSRGADAAEAAAPTINAASRLAWLERLAPARVKVAYTLRYHKGEPPEVPGLITRCPNCGEYHGGLDDELVEQERPLDIAGWLVAPDRVVIPDPQVSSAFIGAITVSAGGSTVGAVEAAYGLDRNALILKLDAPLKNAKPLVFDGVAGDRLFLAAAAPLDADWILSIQPFAPGCGLSDRQGPVSLDEDDGVVLDATGRPVRLVANGKRPVAAASANYDTWPFVSAAEFEARRQAVEARIGAGIHLATLHFRSPKENRRSDSDRFSYRSNDDEDAQAPIQYALAIQTGPKQILVLKKLDPPQTARLEKILLAVAGRDPVEATFVATLAHYAAFTASCDALAEQKPVPVFNGDLAECRDRLLQYVTLSVRGDQLVTAFGRRRIASFTRGWRGITLPELQGKEDEHAAFDADGRLVLLPLIRRSKADAGEGYSYRYQEAQATPVADFIRILANLEGDVIDPSNVPLSEADENRTAWLGVDLQELTPELATANKVTHLIERGGRSGALVTAVYPDSPASRAGLRSGDILLRIHTPAASKPIPVSAESDSPYGSMPFPWERLDELPEEMFNQIPPPWPAVQTVTSKTLAMIGFGKPFQLEYARGGAVARLDLVVELSPPHFNNTPKIPFAAIGLSACNTTFEVARTLRRKADAPGVVVSRVEPGSPAAVAGIKPFELITHVDDQPVADTAAFQKQIADKGEFRLTVRRMNRERIVPLKLLRAEK